MITKMIKVIALTLTLISSCVYAARIVNLAEGDATTIGVPSGISSVFISNPEVADYQVIDQNKVVVFGKQIGSATLMVFDDEGNTQVARKLIVNKSLVHIQQQIQLRYPKADVSIYNLAEQAVLSGTVATQEQKDGIYNLVGELLGKDAEVTNVAWKLGSESYNMDFMQKTKFKGVVNNIDVVSTKQVNVKISVAEVSHSFLENFGVEIGTTEPGVFVDQLINISASDVISVITALGDDNVGQVLAEPNLSVISGETASFLVGGELPVVTIVDGGTNVLYKEYGIRLELMAKVLRDDKIKLSLMPEVSSLDNQYENATYNLPALKTRRARTTIELGDGQSFVLGGLLNTEDRESLRKIPYIGDIPILGALFRKTGTERRKTELVIVATVNLVEPVKASQVQLPMMERTSNLSRFFAIDKRYPKSEDKWLQQVLASGGFKQ